MPSLETEQHELASDGYDAMTTRSTADNLARRLGRAIFGGYFLYNGINHFLNRTMLTEYARAQGVPAAEVAVPASGALIAVGGLLVMTEMRPKLGASLITTFLLGVTPMMHAYWNAGDENERMQEFVNFTKNVALAGGAALAAQPTG
jgi:uncharacterized membrane protein YphA (DoxX/SURF4 family)